MKAINNRCILSPLGDAVFFVAMPLVILAVFAGAQRAGCEVVLAALVMSALSLGHHFPGFLRIYSDPELFARYRLRFVVVPPVLAAGALALARFDFKALAFLVFFWGLWHGLMQVYGFARIYDAKVGDTSRISARLDWALCTTWFVALTLNGFREVNLRHYSDQVGLGFLAELLLARPFVQTLVGAAALVAGLYLGNLGWRIAAGKPVSWMKQAMMATTMLLLFVSYRNFADNPLVSAALFEAYHDLQYFAIVWSFGRKQSERGSLRAVGAFLFQPKMVVVYVLATLLYGTLDYPMRYLEQGQLLRQATVLVLVSTLLHFYFDGFIWKIRKQTIRLDDGVRTPSEPAAPPGAGWSDLLTQLSLLAVPVAALTLAQANRARFELPAFEFALRLVPTSADSQFAHGRLLARYGQTERAMESYEAAVANRPAFKDAWYNLGVLAKKSGRLVRAEAAFRMTIESDPKYAFGYLQLVNILQDTGRRGEAAAVLADATRKLGNDPALRAALLERDRAQPAP